MCLIEVDPFKSSHQVHATGVVVETGKKFWSTKDPGQEPFRYQAGVGEVITGWDKGYLPVCMCFQYCVCVIIY
jgi:FKBP-type peptidyl-prolyl cis-trans isomerase